MDPKDLFDESQFDDATQAQANLLAADLNDFKDNVRVIDGQVWFSGNFMANNAASITETVPSPLFLLGLKMFMEQAVMCAEIISAKFVAQKGNN